MTSSLTRRWPSQSQEPFSLESVLDLEYLSEPKPSWQVIFVICPTNQMSVAQGLFLGRTRCRAVAGHTRQLQKYLEPCQHSSKKGAPQASGDKPSPTKEG